MRYFANPTPGGPNGNSTIVAVCDPVHFTVQGGHFTQPFMLVLSTAYAFDVNRRAVALQLGSQDFLPEKIRALESDEPVWIDFSARQRERVREQRRRGR